MSSFTPEKLAVCFGEILWDNLPSGRKAGGAPMNVAYHLQQLGVNSLIISRIGNDEPGADLLDLLKSRGLNTTFCRVDAFHPTSQVIASVGVNNNVSYEILSPAAWDFIAWENEFENIAAASEVFVFGSLATRNSHSAGTLHRLLDHAGYRVFDVNLRKPHFTLPAIEDLMHKTDLLKLNEEELEEIGQWLVPHQGDEARHLDALHSAFGINEILLTRGSRGASYFNKDERYDHEGYQVIVADTVGSGDACLAGFLSAKLRGFPPEEALDFACAMGAFITTKSGACPQYDGEMLAQFISVASGKGQLAADG